MKISIITLFPNMVSGFFNESIVKRACKKKLVKINLINLRDFAINNYGQVDDRPYGGGAGMIIRVEPVYNAIQSLNLKKKDKKSKIVLTSAKGKVFNQEKAKEYSKLENLVLIAGHYEGVDERVLKYVDEEISIGDFILTGGEIVASAITDSVVRLLPSVLKKEEAVKDESFSKRKGQRLLEYPQYTRPEEFKGHKVPEILLSGNHNKINEWKMKKAYEETEKKRKDLLATQ